MKQATIAPDQTGLHHIQRIDNSVSCDHAWQVTVQRKGKIYHQRFCDGQYRSKDKALQAAIAYRDTLLKSLPSYTRAEVANTLRPNNKSGIVGLCKIERRNKDGSTSFAWRASWPPIAGQTHTSRKFSVAVYGEKQAKALAIKARQQALEKLAQEPFIVSLNNHPLKWVGLNCGLKVRIRVA